MDRERMITFVLFILFSYFANSFFTQAKLRYETKKYGEIHIATVNKRPKCGNSSSQMEIEINNKFYELRIGKNSCWSGRYIVGNKIEVIYCKECDSAILPFYNAQREFYLSIAFFFVPLYLLYHLITGKKINY